MIFQGSKKAIEGRGSPKSKRVVRVGLRSDGQAVTELDGTKLLVPTRHRDARGYFREVWNTRTLAREGIDFAPVQSNESYSARRGTVRGLHYQAPPNAQGKLVYVSRGEIRDVVVDVRGGSATYGHWSAAILSAANGHQLFVPPGFLHGFVTLCDHTVVCYAVDAFYAPKAQGAVRWNDPTLKIDWGFSVDEVVLSGADGRGVAFGDWISPFSVGHAG